MFNYNAHSSTTAALLSAILMLAVTTVAASATDARTVTVQSGDLNLAKDAGRTVFKDRIALAVEVVCDPVHGRTPWEIHAYAACRKAARASAESQFNAMVAKAQTEKKVAVEGNNGASAQ